MDIMMPNMDDIECCRNIKNNSKTKDIKVQAHRVRQEEPRQRTIGTVISIISELSVSCNFLHFSSNTYAAASD
jgi:CheY-like chemotaxis protein